MYEDACEGVRPRVCVCVRAFVPLVATRAPLTPSRRPVDVTVHPKSSCRTCEELSTALLHEAGVAVLPGTDFGAGGRGNIRISYVRNIEVLKEGMDRIEAYLLSKK